MSLSTLLGLLIVVTERANAAPFMVGYFTNWAQYRPGSCSFSPSNIVSIASKLTHVHYAFAKIDANGAVLSTDERDASLYKEFVEVCEDNNLKPVIAVGGWTWNGENPVPVFSTMASSSLTRGQFVSNIIAYCRNNRFTGLALDWEYPADISRGGSAADTVNFARLLSELREQVDAEAVATGQAVLTLAVAGPAGPGSIDAISPGSWWDSVDYVCLVPHLAFKFIPAVILRQDKWLAGDTDPSIRTDVDIHHALKNAANYVLNTLQMAYDYYGASWSSVACANAPLDECVAGSGLSIRLTLDRYLVTYGVAPEKIVLGLAAYGRTFQLDPSNSCLQTQDACGMGSPSVGTGEAGSCTQEAGFLGYNEIVRTLYPSSALFDDSVQSAYSYTEEGRTWVAYDNEQSVTMKAGLVAERGLGGVFLWALDLDDFQSGFPLLRAASAVVLGGDGDGSGGGSDDNGGEDGSSDDDSSSDDDVPGDNKPRKIISGNKKV